MFRSKARLLKLLLYLGGVANFWGCGTSENIPSGIYATPAVHDFGSPVDTAYVEGTFQIVNSTPDSIQIINTEVSCGCTELDLEQRVIPAGEAVLLRLRANVEGRFGPQVFNAILVTDSKSTPALSVQLTGHLATTKVSGVLGYDLGSQLPNSEFNESVSVPKGTASTIRINGIDSNNNGALDAEMIQSPSGSWECKISGRTPKSNGDFTATITLVADNSSDWKEQALLIKGTVKSRWIYQEQCHVGIVGPGKSAKKTILIHDRYIRAPSISENPVISAKVLSTSKTKGGAD